MYILKSILSIYLRISFFFFITSKLFPYFLLCVGGVACGSGGGMRSGLACSGAMQPSGGRVSIGGGGGGANHPSGNDIDTHDYNGNFFVYTTIVNCLIIAKNFHCFPTTIICKF